MANSFSFLDFIFILFYTRLLDFCLTIVNCKCFVSPVNKHHILVAKIQNNLEFRPIFLFFRAE